MTVSGSGRTREKDTRAPARGPFYVFGSMPAGEEGDHPFFVTTCQQGGFHGMDGLCLCGVLSLFNKARFIMKLLEKARAAG